MSDGCGRVASTSGSPPSCLAEMFATWSASATSSSRRSYGWRTMLFWVSVMWCSNRTTSSNPSARRTSAAISIVSLLTELLQLKPHSGELPSSRANSLAPISVHRAAYGLSLPMNTLILNSMSMPSRWSRYPTSTVPGLRLSTWRTP